MRNIGFTVMMGSEKPCSGSWGGDFEQGFVRSDAARQVDNLELLKPDYPAARDAIPTKHGNRLVIRDLRDADEYC